MTYSKIRKEIIRPFTAKKQTQEKPKVKELELDDDATVIAWEPPWLQSTQKCENGGYYFNLLSHLVVGAYDVDPLNGRPRGGKALESLVDPEFCKCVKEPKDKAARDIQILLLVGMYGDYLGTRSEDVYGRFFQEDSTQENLIANLRSLHEEGLIDGIVLDFPKIGENHEDKFMRLVVDRLHTAFGDRGKGSFDIFIRMPFPAENPIYGQIHKKLAYKLASEENSLIEGMIVRTYPMDLNRKFGEEAWGGLAAFSADTQYLKQVIEQISFAENEDGDFKELRKKLRPILEFPFWGLQVNGNKDKYSIADVARIPSKNLLGKKGATSIEEDWMMPYVSLSEGQYTYFQNAQSLRHRLDGVQADPNFGGIAFADLQHGDNEAVWAMIGEKFKSEEKDFFYPVLAFVLLFIPMGMVYAVIRYWQVRNFLAAKPDIFVYYMVILLFSILLVAWCFFWNEIGTPMSNYLAGGAIFLLILFPAGRKILSRKGRIF